MSFGGATANDIAKFIALTTAFPSYTANWNLNLHTADPGVGGDATTNVASYGGYAAVLIARNSTNFETCDVTDPYAANASGGGFKNKLTILFPEKTDAGTQDLPWISLSDTSTNQIIYRSRLKRAGVDYTLTVAQYGTPTIAPGSAIFLNV